MRTRVINFLRHDMSARQAFAMALSYWEESRRLPILLVTPEGQTEAVAKSMRVAFSREKKRSDQKVHYGFTTSDSFPYTDAGVRGEAIVLRWRLTRKQNFKNLNLFGDAKELTDGTVL